MKTNLFTYLFLFMTSALFSQRVQVIHNSPDAAAATVDVWVNGVKALDDFAFRTATPFISLPAGTTNVGIAPANSTVVTDTIANFTYNLMMNTTYIIVAEGTLSGTPTYNPFLPFRLSVYAQGRESAAAGTVDVLVHHGSTDAPTVDIRAQDPSTVLVNDASFGDFAGYLTLPVDNYIVRITDATGSTIVQSYQVPLQSLNLGGNALTVVASGFLSPGTNNNGPAFGLYVALSTGGALVPLPVAAQPRIQVIHNSADAAASTVDVYVNGTLTLNDFAFRTATPFLSLPAGAVSVGIAPGNSTSVNDTIANFGYNLLAGNTYVIVAEGIVSATGYSPATPFDLKVYGMGKETAAMAMNVDLLVHHGATDAPTVDVRGQDPSTVLVNDASFGDFAGYLSLPEDDYIIRISDASGSVIVASYAAPLQTLNLEGLALTVVASGFLNPATNSNGPAFGLYVALPTGGPLVQLPAAPLPRLQAIHNSADAAAATVDVYVGGNLAVNDFAFRTATPFLSLPEGITSVGIAPGNSTSANDTIANFDYNLLSGNTYILVADGIVSATGYSPATPFNIYPYVNGREMAMDSNTVDILVHHGCTDAPTVDVRAVDTTTVLVNDLAYSEYAGYLSLPESDYVVRITDATGATVVQSYSAPLSALNLGGNAITVVASGFLNPSLNSNGAGFGLWVALPAGGPLVELPVLTTSVSQIEESVSDLILYPNPASQLVSLGWEQKNAEEMYLVVNNMLGQNVKQINLGNLQSGRQFIQVSTEELSNGIYNFQLIGNKGMQTVKVQIAK